MTHHQQNLHRVFVYGSLMSGQYNHRLLADAQLLEPTRTADQTFILLDLGSYPGVVRPENPTPFGDELTDIQGELYLVTDSQLAALDRLEGHPRFYQRQPVNLAHHDEPAWMYLLPESHAAHNMQIHSGNWAAHVIERDSQSEPITY